MLLALVNVLPPAVTLVPDSVKLRAPMLTAPPAAVVTAPAVTVAAEFSPTKIRFTLVLILVSSPCVRSNPAEPPMLTAVAAVFGNK